LQPAIRKATLRNSKQGHGGGNAAATQAGNREQSSLGARREAIGPRIFLSPLAYRLSPR